MLLVHNLEEPFKGDTADRRTVLLLFIFGRGFTTASTLVTVPARTAFLALATLATIAIIIIVVVVVVVVVVIIAIASTRGASFLLCRYSFFPLRRCNRGPGRRRYNGGRKPAFLDGLLSLSSGRCGRSQPVRQVLVKPQLVQLDR